MLCDVRYSLKKIKKIKRSAHIYACIYSHLDRRYMLVMVVFYLLVMMEWSPIHGN